MALAVTAALLSVETGCGDCTGTYNCPAAAYGQVNVPADLSAPITSVTADGPCSTFRQDASLDAPVLVSVTGSIDGDATVTCQVRAQLSDGTQLAASVSFRALVGCCSDLSTAIGPPTTFALVTAKASS